MSKFELTTKKLATLDDCKEKKLTKTAAAAAVGCSVGTLNKRMAEIGYEYPVHRTKADDKECIRLNFGHVPTGEIAEKIGFNSGTVLYWAAEFELYEPQSHSEKVGRWTNSNDGYELPGGYESEANGSGFLSYTASCRKVFKGTYLEKPFERFIAACFECRSSGFVRITKSDVRKLEAAGVLLETVWKRIMQSDGCVV